MEKAMRIAVVGTGYVGLVSGACLAELGFETWCIDKDAAKIAHLKRGVMPIFEANLEDVVVSNPQIGPLHFTTAMAADVRLGRASGRGTVCQNVLFRCVPVPFKKN